MTAAFTQLDGPLRELFAAVEPHADLADPGLDAIAAALTALAADHDYLVPKVNELGDVSGLLPLYAPESGPRLFLVHRQDDQMSAIHDHKVWVALAPISGVETHRRWQPRTPDDRVRIQIVEEQEIRPTTCVTLQPPDDIHDHGHRMGVGDAAYVLILLGDDQFRYRRSEWDTATGQHRFLEPGDRGRWLESEPFPG